MLPIVFKAKRAKTTLSPIFATPTLSWWPDGESSSTLLRAKYVAQFLPLFLIDHLADLVLGYLAPGMTRKALTSPCPEELLSASGPEKERQKRRRKLEGRAKMQEMWHDYWDLLSQDPSAVDWLGGMQNVEDVNFTELRMEDSNKVFPYVPSQDPVDCRTYVMVDYKMEDGVFARCAVSNTENRLVPMFWSGQEEAKPSIWFPARMLLTPKHGALFCLKLNALFSQYPELDHERMPWKREAEMDKNWPEWRLRDESEEE